MSFKVKIIIIAFSCICLFNFCTTVNQNGEQEIKNDANPPIDYKPNLIQTIKPFQIDSLQDPSVEISQVDIKNPSLIRLKLHLLNTGNTFLTGSLSGHKNIWCRVIDSVKGVEKVINNFKIKEINNNIPEKLAICIVLDHSGSMGEKRALAVQEAVYNLLQNKGDDDYFAIIKYDSKVSIEVPLTNSKAELSNKLQKNGLTNYGGYTAISNGIYDAIKELKKAPAGYNKIIVIFTDGFDNASTIPKDSIVKLSKNTNSVICAVDFGDGINKGFMQDYAESCGGIYHHIYGTDEFNQVFDDIYKRLHNYYLIEFKTSEYSEHKVKVKICLPSDTIVTERKFDNTPEPGSISLLNVYFDFDKTILKEESKEALDGIFALMSSFPNMKIEVRGHTDSQNSGKDPEYNTKLSQKRAEAVKKSIINRGISADRIICKGYGDKIPVSDNNSDEGRALNRRTEFVVLNK